MKYTILLWPHANARYRNETQKLAEAELSVLLNRIAPEARSASADLDMPALSIETDAPLTDAQIAALQSHSLMYGLFEVREGGALLPMAGREAAYLGEDLPGILSRAMQACTVRAEELGAKYQ